MNKTYVPYVFLLLVLVLLCAARMSLFNSGFFTFYDDAYFLLKAKEVGEGVITGKSQWNYIAVKWFPYLDLSSKIQSCTAGYILILAAVINTTLASMIALGIKKGLKYVAICLLVFLPVAGQMSYVTLQTFLLSSSISAILIYWKRRSNWLKRGMLLLAAFLAGLSIFVILPGGILTVVCYCVLVSILNVRHFRRFVAEFGAVFAGVLISLVYMHLCICPLDKILEAMRFTASYFTKSGYHYDFWSMVIAIGLFVRDFIFVCVFYTGAYYLSRHSKIIQFRKISWIGGLMYITLMVLYVYYQKKPVISPAMFFSSLVILPLLLDHENEGKNQVSVTKDSIIRIFLFCFPVIAAMGTNTSLSGRITCFIVAWAFLWFEKNPKTQWYVTLTAILLIIVPSTRNTFDGIKNRDDRFHFTRGNKYFAEISLTEKQKDYFDKVYDLLTEYGFKSDSSVVFTAAFDYATVYAFDAKLSSNFHQINNFLYWDPEEMLRPDFIILCGWDETVIGDKLRTVGWGWPEDFDAYDMGTPESIVLTSADRTVYCRKELRKQEYKSCQ